MPQEAEPRIIVINGFGDLMPETFTGDNAEIDVEEFNVYCHGGYIALKMFMI